MKVSDSVLLEMEVRNVLNTHFTNVYDSGKYYNFKCNVCGDSKLDKKKKRAYILRTKDPMMYFCHNCATDKGIPVTKWMKEYFPFNYRNYVSELMKNRRDDDEKVDKKVDASLFKNIRTKRQQKVEDSDEKKWTRFFKPLTKYPEMVKICEDRKIPKEVYSKWFYASDERHKDNKYQSRIIITFRNKEGKIYYYQGRATQKWQTPKYKSRIGDYNNIYNYYHHDKNEPVIVIEGPIDSVFVQRSIAVTGLKTGDERLDEFKQKYFLLDNDKDAHKKSIKLILEGEYVFNWKLFLKDHKCDVDIKDVNDFILHNKEGITELTFEMLEPYFTKSLYDKIYFV